jgi:hypothetical protein
LPCSNFILTFPPDASSADRVLLLTAVLQADYAHFEKQGGDSKD